MTTARLFERLRALPENVTEHEMKRIMWRAMAPRLALGFAALFAWNWVLWKYLALKPQILESVAQHAGSLLIFAVVVHPFIRIMRMSDEEWERVFGDGRTAR
jgi:hypothetical protein